MVRNTRERGGNRQGPDACVGPADVVPTPHQRRVCVAPCFTAVHPHHTQLLAPAGRMVQAWCVRWWSWG